MLKVAGKAIPIPGCLHGLRSPAVLLPLKPQVPDGRMDNLPRISAALVEALPGAEMPSESLLQGADSMRVIVEFALYWTHEVQRAGGLPVFERGTIVADGRRGNGDFWVAVPAVEGSYRVVTQALDWVLGVINADFASSIGNAQSRSSALAAILRELGLLALHASNTPRFMCAAFEMGIPSALVAGKVFQFGQGAHARWLDSSFTDETPQIAAALARNKLIGARVLRRAGIPVPPHFVAKDAGEASRRAQELGYPVVVKPADQDGGVGVTAGLRSADEVSNAFAAARKYSRTILVEKHIEGQDRLKVVDYRLVVFRGDMILAIERTAGRVTGDGVKTVRALLDERNAGPGPGATPRKPLEFDDEARRLLAELGLTLDSVPEPGRTVFLRRATNYARGGTGEEVSDQVHPDNRRLAIRAAAALRLDLAGVDLLITDIGRSWLDTGAAICEVNGQPYLGQRWPLIYKQILRQMVPGNGRIPIAVLLGASPDGRLAREIAAKLAAGGFIAGRADRDCVIVGDARVAKGPLSPFAGGQILMSDKTVEAAVLCANDPSVLRSGLPFDRFDVLVAAGNTFHDGADRPMANPSALLQELLQALRPACQGRVFLSADLTGMQADQLAALVCQEMRAQRPAA